MKDQLVGAIIVFFIALFAYTKLAGPIPLSVTQVTTTKTDSFTVTGTGKVTASPDVALVNAGVQATGTTVKQVQDDLNKNTNAVTQAVKRLGVADRDIQTSQYNVSPQYDYTAGRQRITGYMASSNMTIKVRDLTKANAVVDAATANGANQVGGISFDVDDKTKFQNEARKMAVEDAKRKATDAAKIAGFGLGKIINYSENFGGGGYPVPLMARAEGAAKDAVIAPTQLEPGSTEVMVEVYLSYEVR